jgi:hypothetical protein
MDTGARQPAQRTLLRSVARVTVAAAEGAAVGLRCGGGCGTVCGLLFVALHGGGGPSLAAWSFLPLAGATAGTLVAVPISLLGRLLGQRLPEPWDGGEPGGGRPTINPR